MTRTSGPSISSLRAGPIPLLVVSLLTGLATGWLLSRSIPRALLTPQPSISESLLAEPRLIERTAVFAPLLAEATPDLLASLLPRVESFDPGGQSADLALFGDWWARFDPEAANQWAKTYERDSDLRIRHSVFRTWAHTDPHLALGYAKASYSLSGAASGSLWQNPAVTAVLLGWDESGLPGLRQWILESDKIDRQIFMQIWAGQRVAVMTPEAVWKWAEEFPDPFWKEMLPAVAAALAARSPEDAVRLAMPSIERGDEIGLAQRISTRWINRDPQRALEWISTILDGTPRDNAVVEAVRNWNSKDRDGFGGYMEERLAEFPDWLEPAFELYSRVLVADGFPERGLAIAERLSDPDRRIYNTTKILAYWLIQDRASASAWMEAHGVDETIRKRAGYLGSDS